LGAKARALLHGRTAASAEDVRAIALPVLRHRLVLTFAAEADGIAPEQVITRLLQTVPEP
jgi:MoxR-like ATPase